MLTEKEGDFWVQCYLGKELWIAKKGPVHQGDFVHRHSCTPGWARWGSFEFRWVGFKVRVGSWTVSWRSAASSKCCSPPCYTLYWEPCHPNLAQRAAPPSPAHSSTEQEVPIPGTACKPGSSPIPAPPLSSDFFLPTKTTRRSTNASLLLDS